ncbi:MAG: glycosyl hydrolase family 18 protein, partial [Planctomycetota bacterium]
PAVRDGITAFAAQLRAALDALGPGYELSIYTNAIYSSNQWNFDATTGLTPSIDYMLYSMYDWASGLTPRAISDFDNCLGSTRMHAYLNDGLPPEKLVPVVSAYSRSWTGVSTYGATGTSAASSGFTDGLFDTTLNASIGTPAQNYVRGDEAAWYTWTSGTPRVRTFEGLEGMEYKLRHVLSLQDPSGRWSGRRLGGVGFWSLMWLSEFTSVDPRTGGTVGRTRTYPHVYELAHEILGSDSTRAGEFTMETFSGLDFRWRDPNESPDTSGDSDGDSSRSLVPSPSGRDNALRVTYDFDSDQGGRAVIAHEVLASPLAPTVTDTQAVLGRLSPFMRIRARIFVPEARPADSIRMLVVDGSRQLESSPPHSLDRAGWHTLNWDLSDPLSINAYATQEPAFLGGNSILDTAGFGTRDIGFYGFAIDSEEEGRGVILLDEIRYGRTDPGGRSYRINEFHYARSDGEFVEVHGPAGPLPPGLGLRIYRASDGSVARTMALAGTIPDLGGGTGVLAFGDPGVGGVSSSAGFSDSSDDLGNASPTALQLVDRFSLHVYDNVVYEAFGGLGDLIRRETLGVTSGGWPWLGEGAAGASASGAAYALGRFPDGADTRRNARDFSFQLATPGAPNGDALSLPAALDFESPDPSVFTTFGAPILASPTAAGLPPSPNGGNAWRCVDPAGGGLLGAAGDAALGWRRGFEVSGQLYVTPSTAPAQAIAVGVCGRQGSRFFPEDASARQSGYESGYWLIYENRSGVGLNDGRPDHGATWELVHATNDAMDGEPVEILATLPNFILGILEGQWTTFSFAVTPYDDAGDQLIVSVNDQELYRGPLPEGGPQSGAFQVGFRENHPGAPNAAEGTWVDGIRIVPRGPADAEGDDG